MFWGTTNADDYLKDETGGRRFWPIKVGKIDIDGLRDARDQLWAEAVVLYQVGTPWWLTKDDVVEAAERQQRDRYLGDPWEETIERYVRSEDEVTVDMVLRFGLQLDIKHCGQLEKNRAARILKSLGLVRFQRRIGDIRVWRYRKPVTPDDPRYQDDNVTAFRPVTPPGPVTRETPAAQAGTPVSPVSPPF